MFSRLPDTPQAQVIGKQVLRSGTFVGANYREAFRGRSRAEFISKCGDSRRELEETAYWLELLADADLVRAERLVSFAEGSPRVDRHFRYHSEAFERETFLTHNS
jgi:four helix bundle protein